MKSGSKKQNDNSCANCRVYLFDYGLKQPYCSECYEEAKAQPQYKETAECLAEELMLQQRKLAAAARTIDSMHDILVDVHEEAGCMGEPCFICELLKLTGDRHDNDSKESLYVSAHSQKECTPQRGDECPNREEGEARQNRLYSSPRLPASVEGVSDSPPCPPPPRKQKREASR